MQERSNIPQRTFLRRPLVLWAVAISIPVAAFGIVNVLERKIPNDDVSAIAGLESIAWPRQSAPRAPATTAPTNAAPVADLITGLEKRLADRPNDVKGWALLAQSYAFVANEQGTEIAFSKAVSLGFDESDLRQRIELASRSPQTSAVR